MRYLIARARFTPIVADAPATTLQTQDDRAERLAHRALTWGEIYSRTGKWTDWRLSFHARFAR